MLLAIALLLAPASSIIIETSGKPEASLPDVTIAPSQQLNLSGDTFAKEYIQPLGAELVKQPTDQKPVKYTSDTQSKGKHSNLSYHDEDLGFHGGQTENSFMTSILEGNNLQAFLSVFLQSQDQWCHMHQYRLRMDAKAIAETAKAGTEKFKDGYFPPSWSTLYWRNNVKAGQEDQISSFNRKFKYFARPSQIEKTPSLWGTDGIKPDGVVQGELGDCWFLAAAAAVAEQKERIEKIFTEKEYSPNGVFLFNLFYMGEPVKIVIDDYLPIKKEGEEIQQKSQVNNTIMVANSSTSLVATGSFANGSGEMTPITANKSPTGGWWLPLLEKAFAKRFQHYSNINGGQPREALRTLLGMPTMKYKTSELSAEEVLEIIADGDKKKYVMTAGILQSDCGLYAPHAYTLLGTVNITVAGKKVPLVKLRNPHGQERYNCAWNDLDPKWTEALRTEAGATKDTKDGTFFMEYKAFDQLFQQFSVALFNADWITDSKKQLTRDKTFQFQILNPSQQELSIDINFPGKRDWVPGCDQAEPSFTFIVLDPLGQRKIATYVGDEGYEIFHSKKAMEGNWTVKIEKKDSNDVTEFVIKSWADKEKAKISDYEKLLGSDIDQGIKNGDVEMEGVNEQWRVSSFTSGQDIHVKVEKRIGIEVKSTVSFVSKSPFNTIESNVNWRIGFTYNVSTDSKWYEGHFICPESEPVCIYKFPDYIRYKNTHSVRSN